MIQQSTIDWETDIGVAMNKAAEADIPVMIDVYNPE